MSKNLILIKYISILWIISMFSHKNFIILYNLSSGAISLLWKLHFKCCSFILLEIINLYFIRISAYKLRIKVNKSHTYFTHIICNTLDLLEFLCLEIKLFTQFLLIISAKYIKVLFLSQQSISY